MAGRGLTVKQDLVFKVFSSMVAKQEVGKAGAREAEQLCTTAEAVADKILSMEDTKPEAKKA